MRRLLLVLGMACLTLHAEAATVATLSSSEASNGMKQALIQAAGKAVSQLGTVDGFLANARVRIPLPDGLKKAEKAMRMFGMARHADELVLKMNRAAEAAVPEARILLVNAVKQMSVADAKVILTGADDAATQYFRRTTAEQLAEKFLPIVQKITADADLARQYNRLVEKGSRYGLLDKNQANLEQYVTQKTLDGVYLMMAEEEKAIRGNPLGQGSALLRKVFGALP